MAIVLVFKPWGLMGREQAPSRSHAHLERPYQLGGRASTWIWAILFLFLCALPIVFKSSAYTTVLAIDLLTATLFACSLHFLMGPSGMHSFGHAAFFGLGAYAASLLVIKAQLPMELSLLVSPMITVVFAVLIGWFCVRLSGVYLAMLTLAFSQILWSICFQWDGLTGGSNGLTGVWPSELFKDKESYYYLSLFLVSGSLFLLRRILFSPLGYALRGSRDSSVRAQAIGMDVKTLQWTAFAISGLFAGLSGAIFAFSKGSISPDSLGISKSVDALVMVLLGGLQTISGPILGAVSFTWLQDFIVRETQYWRACLGAVILLLVLVFPTGLVGFINAMSSRWMPSVSKATSP